jgi:hypothetical protein
MPQRFVVDHSGLRNRIIDNDPLKVDSAQVAALRRLGKGTDLTRQQLLDLIEEENKICPNE